MTIKADMGDINAINSANTLAALISPLRMPAGLFDPVRKCLLVNALWVPWFDQDIEESRWYEIDDLGSLSDLLPELADEILQNSGYHSRTLAVGGADHVLFGWKLSIRGVDYLSLIHI